MKSMLSGLILMAVAIVPAASDAQTPSAADDQTIGVWRLNPDKSTSGPGTRRRPQLRRYDLRPDGSIVITTTGTDAQGNPTILMVFHRTDGKEYPIYGYNALVETLTTGEKPQVGMMAVEPIDPYTAHVLLRNAEGVQRADPVLRVVSKDGKTLTTRSKGPDGTESVAVWDRVR